MKKNSIKDILSTNRTEELGYDVWEYFVLPLFYDELNILEAKKARVIRGGRGCGKTMLLRYLSHYSQFSLKRYDINDEDLSFIGLYWRSDTSFASGLKGWGIEERIWEVAFEHAITLTFALELLKSLESLSECSYEKITSEVIEKVKFDSLSAFDESLIGDVYNLHKELESKIYKFQTWANNPATIEKPIFLPCNKFLEVVIKTIKAFIPELEHTVFSIYIDEYENLEAYQQRIINTLIKHGEPPLIFNIAIKHNGITTHKTTGNESIQNVSDYRTVNLDHLILENDFELFSAEILFSRISNVFDGYCPGLNIDALRRIDCIHKRKEPSYRKKIVSQIEEIFPGYSNSDIATIIFKNKTLFNKLKTDIKDALNYKDSPLNYKDFILESEKEASIIISCLLNRKNNAPEDIAEELQKLTDGSTNKFTGRTNWIKNYFVAEVLRLYEGTNSKICPLYSGFNTFITLSRGNLRYFLELCYTSIRQNNIDQNSTFVISQEEQSAAAREASILFIKNIRGSGKYGNILHSFVLSLGSLFSLTHSRRTQSEPEINHFVIGKGESISDEEQNVLNEAVKWSILFEEEETKVKTENQLTRTQWVLNPIYAPYFLISYRKMRKIELTANDISILISGNYDDRTRLLKRYVNKWELKSSDLNMSLFSHMEE